MGKHSDELHVLLKGLSEGEGGSGRGGARGDQTTMTTCERRDITGGHISTLLRRHEAIVPAIVATFEKLTATTAATTSTAPAPAVAPNRA